MPEYSKIIAFYIKRKDHKLERPAEDCSMERVVLPAMAYKMSLTTNESTKNILVRTVVDLMKVYERQGMERGAAMDRIARKTRLDPLLVRAILRRNRNNLDRETGEENEGITQSFYYLIYDALSGQPFSRMIPAEKFEEGCRMEPTEMELRKKETAKLDFQIEMGEKRQRAWILHSAEPFFSAPLNPPVSPAIERYYCRGKNASLTYLGIAEPVGLICTCYLWKKDLSTIHVMNPVDQGNMNQLYDRIRETLQAEEESNEELSRCLETLDAERRTLLEEAESYIDAQDKMKRKVLAMYPDIGMYNRVREQIISLETSCAAYKDAAEKDPEMADSAAKDCVTAFHSALEEIFTLSLVKNYPRSGAGQMEKLLESLQGNKNYTAYYLDIAGMAGFEHPERCYSFFENGNVRLRNGVIKTILKRAGNGQDFDGPLPELVAAHMFQAAVEETHPFREVAARCPEILPLTQRSKTARDVFKHGLDKRAAGSRDDVEIPSAYRITQMRVLAETLLEVLLGIARSSASEQRHQEELSENRRAARIRAEEAIEHYPALKKLLKKTAVNVWYRFYYRDPEYFSSCSNLLSKLYDVLFNEYSTQYQRQAAAGWFSGDRAVDDAAIHGLFQRCGCDYESNNRPNTQRIKQFSYNVKDLSVKCKLYLAVVMLDREDPDLLHRILERAPHFPRLTDQICQGRGHNEITRFEKSPDGYEALHQELMDTCERFCEVLLSGKQRNLGEREKPLTQE